MMTHHLGKTRSFFFNLFLIGLFLYSPAVFCDNSFNPCANERSHRCAICQPTCQIKKGCATIPARTQSYFSGCPECTDLEEEVPEARIFYRVQGTKSCWKPTIVFIHGFGETSDIWECAQNALSHCFRTVSMDLRGFGRSSKTPAASPERSGIHYTLQLYSDDIYELLNQLGITENIVMVGHSIGVNYVLKYASQHQDQLSKLVLVNGFPFIVPNCAVDADCAVNCFNPKLCQEGFCNPYGITDTDAARLLARLVECLGAGGNEKECLAVWGDAIAPFWYNEPCQKRLASAKAAFTEVMVSSTVPIITSISNFALTEDPRPFLADISIPVLVCAGENDIVVNPQNSVFMNEQLCCSKLVEFLGKGHQAHVTDYKTFNCLLKQFACGCRFPDFLQIPDHGCDVCPLLGPVDFAREECFE